MNTSDAERLSHLLETYGCRPVKNERDADTIIIVSCSVRQKPMNRVYGKIDVWNSWKKQRSINTVLTGCVLPQDKQKLKNRFDVLIDIKNLEQLPGLLGLSKQKNTNAITNADYLALESRHTSNFQAFVPIMTGCNNYCTYCAVPYTRGEETSRSSSEIINEVTALLKKGYKEITLLGQNVNAYIDPDAEHKSDVLKTRARESWQFKKNQPVQFRSATTNVPKDFATLLKKIDSLPGDFWIRFLTSNPQDVSDELLITLPQCKKVTKYFHLPIQSGDDEILRRMNRRHTRDYYLQLVSKIKKAWHGVAITTDVIVGFPGETREQFQKTVELMETVRYDMAYLAEYSPRPGTAAERFFEDTIPREEKKRRKKVLNDVLERIALEKNKKLIGKTVRVLVDTYNKEKTQNSGKTEGFKTIHFTGENYTGKFIEVSVTEATAWGLVGKK